jgi:tetratricopeptide (TPR) repeat protein
MKASSSPTPRSDRIRDLALALLLAAATIWAFRGVAHAGFVGFDDGPFVFENPHLREGLSAAGLRWALTADLLDDSPNTDYWSPVTLISRLLDAELFGLDPGAHHLVNLAIHVTTVILLFFIMRRLTGRPGPSAFVAAVLGVHPLHVEAVAWVTERKDVLAGLFWVLAMGAHGRYVQSPTRGRQAVLAVTLGLGLMAKPMLVTLPLALLLLDYWPLGRWSSPSDLPRLVREKTLLIALAAASAVITVLPQLRGGGLTPLDTLPFQLRLGNAVRSYVAYLEQALWPHPLAFYYPHPGRSLGLAAVALSFLVLAAITAWAWRERHRWPFAVVGWAWYLLTLLPVIGLVQVGEQARADRFTYIPFIGLSFLPAFGLPALIRSRRGRQALAAGAAALVVVWCVLTRAQVQTWRDSETLFRHALQVTGGSPLVHYNLGNELQRQGRRAEAREQYRAALRLKPRYPQAQANLGGVLAQEGDLAGAATAYRAALALEPRFVEAHTGLSTVLLEMGHPAEALRHATEAVRLSPALASAHFNLGLVQARLGRVSEAERSYRAALARDPGLAAARYALGNLLAAGGRLADAEEQFREAVRLEPGDADALNNLGRTLTLQGRRAEALAYYRQALEADPGHTQARQNMEETLREIGAEEAPPRDVGEQPAGPP